MPGIKNDLEGIIRGIESGIKAELAEIIIDISDLRPNEIDETLLLAFEKAECEARCRVERAKNGG